MGFPRRGFWVKVVWVPLGGIGLVAGLQAKFAAISLTNNVFSKVKKSKCETRGWVSGK